MRVNFLILQYQILLNTRRRENTFNCSKHWLTVNWSREKEKFSNKIDNIIILSAGIFWKQHSKVDLISWVVSRFRTEIVANISKYQPCFYYE